MDRLGIHRIHSLNLHNLWTQIAWTFATRVVMIFNSLAAGIIVAHWLGAEGVGQLAVINVAVATIVQVGSFGLPSSNTYFIAQDQAHFRAAAFNSLVFALGVGSLLALALSATASWRPDWFGLDSVRLIHIAAVSIPFQLITLIGLNVLLAIGKIRQFNILDLVSQSFVLINAVCVWLWIRGDHRCECFGEYSDRARACYLSKESGAVEVARRHRTTAADDYLRAQVSCFNSGRCDHHSR